MDRSLVAFAFLAQASRTEGDLLSGLAPLFKPLAKTLAGKRFDGTEFAAEVAKRYGIKVNSWAVDDFAPRLEAAGVLLKVQLSPDAHEYHYAPVQEDFTPVTESDISKIVEEFKQFADPILNEHKLDIPLEELETLLLHQLTDLNFLSILLAPQQADTPDERRAILGLRKSADQVQWERETEGKARIDVLCAAFIFYLRRTSPTLYDLLVRVASGALVLEVVLDFQEPQFKGTLERLTIILDAPFLMSLLDLSSELSHVAAKAVCEEMRAHKVQLATFDHCVEELKDNLKSVRTSYQAGIGFGATARRLIKPAFSAYLNAILIDPLTALKKQGIRLMSAASSTQSFQFFTEQDEANLRAALGSYYNAIARDRDAASIAGIVRLRRGARARMARFGTAVAVFVTHNTRVADCARTYTLRRRLYDQRDVPPAITDRYLAGLLWVMYGGKAGEIAPKLLLANCAAALEPRSDVINRMQRFLTDVSPQQAEMFKVLMTDERAGQHLMQITLGDSAYITAENAEETLAKIRESVGHEIQARADEAVAQMRAEHERDLRERDQSAEQLKAQLAAAAQVTSAERERAASLKEAVQRGEAEAQSARAAAQAERMTIVQSIATEVSARGKRLQWVIASAFALVSAAVAFVLTLPLDSVLAKLVLIALGAAAVFSSFWRVPDLLIRPMLTKYLEGNLEDRLHALAIYTAEREFLIDAWAGTVGPRPASPSEGEDPAADGV